MARFGLLRVYPHPVVLSIFSVGIGFLAGYVSSQIDEIRRERPLFEMPISPAKGLIRVMRQHLEVSDCLEEYYDERQSHAVSIG